MPVELPHGYMAPYGLTATCEPLSALDFSDPPADQVDDTAGLSAGQLAGLIAGSVAALGVVAIGVASMLKIKAATAAASGKVSV